MAENVLRRIVFGKPVKSILFVDQKNTDASAICEILARNRIRQERRYAGILVSSAGFSAENGLEMSARAAGFLARKGFDTDKFRSKKLTEEMIDGYELVLTMEMGLKGMILFLRREIPVYTISEYALSGGDFEDFETMDDAQYIKACEELSGMIEGVLKRATRNTVI